VLKFFWFYVVNSLYQLQVFYFVNSFTCTGLHGYNMQWSLLTWKIYSNCLALKSLINGMFATVLKGLSKEKKFQ